MHRYPLHSKTGLPPEMIHRVFRLLPQHDLKNSVLVNKKFRDVGESPDLWRISEVRVRSREDTDMLTSRRLARVREVDVNNADESVDWQQFFQAVDELSELKMIRGLVYNDLRAVEENVLARVLTRLDFVGVDPITPLIDVQMSAFFTQATVADCQIKTLCLWDHDQTAVSAVDLAKVVIKVEWVNLSCAELTTEQLTDIIDGILDEDIKIKNLLLTEIDLSELPADKLARAVNKLESVRLENTSLSNDQINRILAHFLDKESKILLKKGSLCICQNDMSTIDRGLHNRALLKLAQSGEFMFGCGRPNGGTIASCHGL